MQSAHTTLQRRKPQALRAIIGVLGLLVIAALLAGLVLQLGTIGASVELGADKDVDHATRVLEEKQTDALALATLLAQDPTLRVPFEELDRPALLDRFEEPYQELRRDHGVTHLHFAVPPATSLLRVHAPDTFGDDLTAYRPMLVDAMASGQPLSGFERGRFGTSARAVVPVRVAERAVDSWRPEGDDPMRVLGVVDLGYSLDEALLDAALSGSEVAVVTLPSQAVASSLDRSDPPAVSSTLDASIDLRVEDAGQAAALVDGDLEELVPHDTRRWRLSRVVLTDHLGGPAAVLLVASDISGASRAALLATLATGLTVAVMVGVAGLLVLVRRRSQRVVDNATTSIVRSGQLGRALRLADSEERILEVVSRALERFREGDPARLLLADSSRAHLSVAIDQGFGAGAGQLPTPGRCPATRSGEVQRFDDPEALDVCPFSLGGGCESPAGVDGVLRCQPLSIQGATIGVLQLQTTGGELQRHVEHQLDDLVRQTGDQLSGVRAQAESTLQAGTDPLTGLANRRSFDAEVSRCIAQSRPYAVLFADLDHFKQLNDTHGHDVGDRALRLFAGVLQASVRPEDVVARYGGEEFVLLLAGCDAAQAHDAADRIRDELALALTAGAVPGFTVSIGIADHRASGQPFDSLGFDEVLGAADAALLRAKDGGRNRVVVHEVAAATVSAAPAT